MTRYVLHTPRAARRGLDLEGELNEQQRAVVLAGEGPLLVIAGAGTGKTRTLTYRAAQLIHGGRSPEQLLLCTFTNRAAREMVQRVEGLLDVDLKRLWAGTFHHVANMALRRYGEQVGLLPNYAILDREDARDLMAVCLGEEGPALRKLRFPKPALLQSLVSRAVDSQLPLAAVVRERAPRFVELTGEIQRVVDRFVARKLKLGLVDYDDLLLFFKILLSEHPGPAGELTARFEHVLVDEYQDTSLLQGQIVDACASRHGNLTVVGDDAQSIYSFRGAHFRNILEFTNRYPGAQVFKLETNYRSSPEVLRLANACIAQNERQYPKLLRPVRGPSQAPALIPLTDVYQQAAFVAQRVLELTQEEGVPLRQVAVLYRAHAHSLELQVELTRRNIPFSVRSGLRFFEQAHIKDITAFLRLAHNPGDALAWQRVLRLWPGVGTRTADQLLLEVEQQPRGRPADELLASPELRQRLHKRAATPLARLGRVLRQVRGGADVPGMIETVVERHYREYATASFPNAETRLEDLQQLAAYTAQYDSLQAFLSELALVAGITAEGVAPGELPEEKMTLSTVHQAKGLEWRVVFILWTAEGRFPQAIAVRTRDDEEEERRLFYVALTRAEQQLYLCFPRFEEPRDGPRRILRLSRFLAELPDPPPYERWEIEEQQQ
jgi:DNA helicase-2/ATP-dependent DNA helicase PcrA